MLSLFECITRSSSVSIEEAKLIAIGNWIFHISEFLQFFMMLSNKIEFHQCFLWLIRLYFYHYYFHIQLNCCYKNDLLLPVYSWPFFFFCCKRLIISVIIFSSIALIIFNSEYLLYFAGFFWFLCTLLLAYCDSWLRSFLKKSYFSIWNHPLIFLL